MTLNNININLNDKVDEYSELSYYDTAIILYNFSIDNRISIKNRNNYNNRLKVFLNKYNIDINTIKYIKGTINAEESYYK